MGVQGRCGGDSKNSQEESRATLPGHQNKSAIANYKLIIMPLSVFYSVISTIWRSLEYNINVIK